MAEIPTVWLSFNGAPASGRWDQTWLTQLVPAGIDEPNGWDNPAGDATIIVTGGVDPDQLATVLDRLDRVLLIVASNEEALFPHHRFASPNRVLWLHTPTPNDPPVGWRHVRFLPTGWTPLPRLAASCPTKTIPWVFAGQVTHRRRRSLASHLAQRHDGMSIPTESFAAGLPRDDYADLLRAGKLVPCPAGHTSIDTFRVYEALEAGAVPVLDSKNSQDTVDGPLFWDLVLGDDHPLTVANHWAHIHGIIDGITGTRFVSETNRVGAWWTRLKRQWRTAYTDDWHTLGVDLPRKVDDDITVIITASPIPSHPEPTVLDATVNSIRDAGLNSEIVVCFDGVRTQQHLRTGDYEEHIRRVIWAANHRWDRVSVRVADDHVHQANLTRAAVEEITTPYLLFVEHDTPLVGTIDWTACTAAISTRQINSIRFHYSEAIHPDHQHLTEHSGGVNYVAGCPLVFTRQWSQRPHLASADWYRDVLDAWFPADSNTMIEDRLHGPAANAPWGQWRLAIYAPEGGFLRSAHLDGRGNDYKWDMSFGTEQTS